MWILRSESRSEERSAYYNYQFTSCFFFVVVVVVVVARSLLQVLLHFESVNLCGEVVEEQATIAAEVSEVLCPS